MQFFLGYNQVNDQKLLHRIRLLTKESKLNMITTILVMFDRKIESILIVSFSIIEDKFDKKKLMTPQKIDTIRLSISYRSMPEKYEPGFVRLAVL